MRLLLKKWKLFKKKHPVLLGNLSLAINLLLIALLFEEAGTRGLLFAASVLLILVLIRVVRGWSLIMDLMRTTETVIFGKSLNKENWQAGELKNTKVKINWKKKKKIKKKN